MTIFGKLRPWLTLVTISLLAIPASAQSVRKEIHFPDLPGHITLKCDLHMHTVFSDGNVWPPVRVDEAWRQGLDAISITDHLEYQPKKDDIPTQHNRPYELAVGTARAHNLLLIHGAEITRDTPPGHFNAVFLQDAKPLDTPEFLDAVTAANQQQAFVFWNHQGWKGEERGRWLDVHTTMFEGKMFQGMEVCNGDSYFPTAHRWCLEKNLTMLGNSDIHDPDLLQESSAENHRTMTLVFASDRTVESVKEALLAGRTVVWYQNQLIGRREYLDGLFRGAVQVQQPVVRSGKTVWMQVHNACEANMELTRRSGNGPQSISLPARRTVLIRFNTAARDTPLDLQYTATNLLVAPETGLDVTLALD